NTPGNTITTSTAINISGGFTLTAGSFTAPASTLTVGGSFSNSGTFTHNSGTVTLNSTGAASLTGATTFNDLNFTSTGTYQMPAANTTIRGNVTVASGASITKGSGTVIFAKGGTQSYTDSNATSQDLGPVQVSSNTTNTTLNLGSSAKM